MGRAAAASRRENDLVRRCFTGPDPATPLFTGGSAEDPLDAATDVALLVLRGASTQAIGAELYLSAYPVKDHLKSIFDKSEGST